MEKAFLLGVVALANQAFHEATTSPGDFGEKIDGMRGLVLALDGVAQATGFDDAAGESLEGLENALGAVKSPGELLVHLGLFSELAEAIQMAEPMPVDDATDDEESGGAAEANLED